MGAPETLHPRPPRQNAGITQFNKQARAPDIVALFDVLRTQLAQTFAERRLRTLAITAPHSGCGTSFIAAGLLASFARRNEERVLALDLNLGAPALHRFFELQKPRPDRGAFCLARPARRIILSKSPAGSRSALVPWATARNCWRGPSLPKT